MLQWLYMSVTKVCYRCFIYVFKRMLQMCLSECYICCICFYLEVFVKVFKCFQVFFQVFQKDVASVCFKYFNCFRHILQVFYLKLAYVVVATHML
jgi:hypothetical protein